MFELLILVVFGWLFIKAIGLAFWITWGFAKILGTILCVIALPSLVGCLLFAGGIFLLLPVILIAAAFFLFKACV